MTTTTLHRTLLLGLLAGVALVAVVATSMGAMRTERINANLCETTGGGRFVDIPGFPGEEIDRRLLRDVKLLERRYKIFVTDGFSDDPIHSQNGEHPLGLALDIVPNAAAGGTWRDVSRLAKWAEPVQNQPIAPFRWVGYNGDSGHGRGHHLHLSWNHSEAKPYKPARTVYTMRCPGGKPKRGGDGTTDAPKPPRDEAKPREPRPSGGIRPGSGTSGGVDARRMALMQASADPVVETGGADAP